MNALTLSPAPSPARWRGEPSGHAAHRLDRPWLTHMAQREATAASLLWEALEQTEQALNGAGSARQRLKQATAANRHARAVAACLRGYTRQVAEELA